MEREPGLQVTDHDTLGNHRFWIVLLSGLPPWSVNTCYYAIFSDSLPCIEVLAGHYKNRALWCTRDVYSDFLCLSDGSHSYRTKVYWNIVTINMSLCNQKPGAQRVTGLLSLMYNFSFDLWIVLHNGNQSWFGMYLTVRFVLDSLYTWSSFWCNSLMIQAYEVTDKVSYIWTASTHPVSHSFFWLLWCCTAEWPLFHKSNRRSSKAEEYAYACFSHDMFPVLDQSKYGFPHGTARFMQTCSMNTPKMALEISCRRHQRL
jgi:hypothetical protein